jgi:hypothetical protein
LLHYAIQFWRDALARVETSWAAFLAAQSDQ